MSNNRLGLLLAGGMIVLLLATVAYRKYGGRPPLAPMGGAANSGQAR